MPARQVGFLKGGFEAAAKNDFEQAAGSSDLRLAGVGGVGGALGWTAVQNRIAKEKR